MIREELKKLLCKITENAYDINISDEEKAEKIVKDFFDSKDIQYTYSCDDMFDSCGFDAWSYCIAWIEDNKPELLVYRFIRY